ncbi:hypothetical protein ACOME3_009076 [Neoechinorhynchus agilis]
MLNPMFIASSMFPHSITKLPTLIHTDNIISNSDEIVEYMDETFTRGPPLNVFDSKAHGAQANIFSKFCFVMRDQADPAALEFELGKLEIYLRSHNFNFLVSNHMSAMDTQLLPKLQHIRVAGYIVKNFTIPTEYTAVWAYLSRAYSSAAFRVTCPTNQEIIWHWVREPSIIRDLFLLKPSYALDDCTTDGNEKNDATRLKDGYSSNRVEDI